MKIREREDEVCPLPFEDIPTAVTAPYGPVTFSVESRNQWWRDVPNAERLKLLKEAETKYQKLVDRLCDEMDYETFVKRTIARRRSRKGWVK